MERDLVPLGSGVGWMTVHGATPSPHPAAAAAAARARAARLRLLRRVTCLVTGGFKAAEPLIVNQDSLLVVHSCRSFAAARRGSPF